MRSVPFNIQVHRSHAVPPPTNAIIKRAPIRTAMGIPAERSGWRAIDQTTSVRGVLPQSMAPLPT